jgi:hypothetical protein
VLVREVFADELQLLLVEQRRLHHDGQTTADYGRYFNSDELQGQGRGGFGACRYGKGHDYLRLATGAREIQAAVNKAESELTITRLLASATKL